MTMIRSSKDINEDMRNALRPGKLRNKKCVVVPPLLSQTYFEISTASDSLELTYKRRNE